MAELLKGGQRRVAGITPIEAMWIAFSKAGVQANWDTICKSLLLSNISDVDPTKGLRALLAGGATEQILCHLSGFRHTPGEYADAFAFILDDARCRVQPIAPLWLVKGQELRRDVDRTEITWSSSRPSASRACARPCGRGACTWRARTAAPASRTSTRYYSIALLRLVSS